MDQLIRENFVVRERGRGTFVRTGAEWRSNSMLSLLDAAGNPITPAIRLVRRQVEPVAEAFQGAFGGRGNSAVRVRVLHLIREWRAGEALVCLETIMVAQDRFPGLGQAADLSAETLFSLYEDRYRIKLGSVRWEIVASQPAGAAAGPGAEGLQQPAVLLRRTATDQKASVIEISEQLVSLAGRSVAIAR